MLLQTLLIIAIAIAIDVDVDVAITIVVDVMFDVVNITMVLNAIVAQYQNERHHKLYPYLRVH